MEWGPWIEHDGLCRPVSRGEYVTMIGEYPDGEIREWVGYIRTDAYSWYWFNYGRVARGGVIPRTIRYRVRKPRALQMLREIAEGIKAPEREDA